MITKMIENKLCCIRKGNVTWMENVVAVDVVIGIENEKVVQTPVRPLQMAARSSILFHKWVNIEKYYSIIPMRFEQ